MEQYCLRLEFYRRAIIGRMYLPISEIYRSITKKRRKRIRKSLAKLRGEQLTNSLKAMLTRIAQEPTRTKYSTSKNSFNNSKRIPICSPLIFLLRQI
jgi:hypothetical protein